MAPSFKAWYFRTGQKRHRSVKLNRRDLKPSTKRGFVKLCEKVIQALHTAGMDGSYVLYNRAEVSAVDQRPNVPDCLQTQDDGVKLCSHTLLRLSACSRVAS